MKSSALTLICIATVSLPALAQSDSSAGQQEYRYVARVKGNNVNIRSRPDVRYGYSCAQVSAPATVRVVREMDGWVEILPTDDCFSVVSADYVRREGSNPIGIITGDRIRIRAGGENRTRSFNVIQGYLNTDDQVRITGQLSDHMGRWYKIAPPLGAYWYISADYVERASTSVERPSPETVSPRPQPGTTPEETTTESPTTSTEPDDDEHDDEAQARAAGEFEEAEEALREEFKKPLPDRDLTGLLKRYQGIDVPEESLLKAYVDARIAHIRHAIARQEAYHSAKRLAEQTAETQRQHELELARIQARTPSVEEVTAYDAEGVLVASEIFTGDASAPKRYTLRDTLSRRINAYVQATNKSVDLSKYAGKKVGIFGRKQYDTDLRLHVVEAEKVIVLSDDPHILQPSRPTVIPRARLTPLTPPQPRPQEPAPESVEEAPEEVETVEDTSDQADVVEQPVEQPPAESDTDEAETEPAGEAEPEIVEPEADDDSDDAEPEAEPVEEEATETEPTTTTAPTPMPETGLEMVTPHTRRSSDNERPVHEEEYD